MFQTVKAFLPEMIKSGKGHIVTVGSVAGLLGTYRCTDYSGTKFATCGFHESLFTELRVRIHLRDALTRLAVETEMLVRLLPAS